MKGELTDEEVNDESFTPPEPEEDLPQEPSFVHRITPAPQKKKVVHKHSTKQSDLIMQNILNASKLLEGRFTYDQLCKLDIPTFEKIIQNEFTNIDTSYERFKKDGVIDAYTRNEIATADSKALRALSGATKLK